MGENRVIENDGKVCQDKETYYRTINWNIGEKCHYSNSPSDNHIRSLPV